MGATVRMAGRRAGRLAGLLLLLAPLHVQMSRSGLADAPMTFFVVAALSRPSHRHRGGGPAPAVHPCGHHGRPRHLHEIPRALSAIFVIMADLYWEFPGLGWRSVLGFPRHRA